MTSFISFTGGVLIAVLMAGAMFIMYSCLNSYQVRMMEQLRKTKNKVYDLEQMLKNQDESFQDGAGENGTAQKHSCQTERFGRILRHFLPRKRMIRR